MKTINDQRQSPEDVEMQDRDGRKIYVSPDATIPDLVKAGVRQIGICKPEDPLPAGWYRDTGI